ncbi:hypothetical protein H733_0749 [Haemophilus influenzae CGSHiCZ412602]|nr:hypothetical protein H733_0749 [Haemophilus influenzae CGSHiCZ412602]
MWRFIKRGSIKITKCGKILPHFSRKKALKFNSTLFFYLETFSCFNRQS